MIGKFFTKLITKLKSLKTEQKIFLAVLAGLFFIQYFFYTDIDFPPYTSSVYISIFSPNQVNFLLYNLNHSILGNVLIPLQDLHLANNLDHYTPFQYLAPFY